MRIEEREHFSRKIALTSKEREIQMKNIITSQVPKCLDFLEKLLVVQQGKLTSKYWVCGEVEHYANDAKIGKITSLLQH